VRGIDAYITGHYGEDQFRKSRNATRQQCNCTPHGRGHWMTCTTCGGRIHRLECRHRFNADIDCTCAARQTEQPKEAGK
jgi:hypothetical protein